MSGHLTLSAFNSLPSPEAIHELMRCCGSKRWCEEMEKARPFSSLDSALDTADRVWNRLTPADWAEAFHHHPRIGEKALREKFASTSSWASEEQKGTSQATEETLRALAAGNAEYEKRFGHIFLVCATGKSADEMLALLKERMNHDPARELRIAAGEQAKITRLRLEKLVNR